MKDYWKYLILLFIAAVIAVFVVVAYCYSMVAGIIVSIAGAAVLVFLLIKHEQSKTKKR